MVRPLVFGVYWFDTSNLAEDVWDEDSAYLEMLANEVCLPLISKVDSLIFSQSARLRARSEKRTDQGDDVSEESEEDIEEELGFFSLIDAINPYMTFKHALTSVLSLPVFLYFSLTCRNSFPGQESGAVSGCDDDAECRATNATHGSHDPR